MMNFNIEEMEEQIVVQETTKIPKPKQRRN